MSHLYCTFWPTAIAAGADHRDRGVLVKAEGLATVTARSSVHRVREGRGLMVQLTPPRGGLESPSGEQAGGHCVFGGEKGDGALSMSKESNVKLS